MTRKLITLILTFALLLAAVNVGACEDNGVSISDGVTIPGGIVELSIYADFKTPVRSIRMEIRYPAAFEYAGLFNGSLLYCYDPVELTIDTEPGLIIADIDVDCIGIVGVGQLLKLNLRVPESYPAGDVGVAVEVTNPADMDTAMSYITVHQPTASDALNLMRWICFGAPVPDAWMDMNGDGWYTACDALLILRRVLEIG